MEDASAVPPTLESYPAEAPVAPLPDEASPAKEPPPPPQSMQDTSSPLPESNEQREPEADDVTAAYRGIVKIEVAVRQPDYATPWQSGRFGGGNGTGFMVGPGLFMTNAHVVADAERIYISPYADARKIKARVKYVAHDADLALVEIDDPAVFKDVPFLQFSDSLPHLEDEVRAIGYPIGGDRLSVTRGIVSRIDTTAYSHPRNASHLTVQIDAAINPGNSGGPVLLGDKVVGVAFQGLLKANSTGYMIPIPVIKRFLKDVEDGHYDHYVDLGVTFFPLVNPAMRKHYGLPDNARGVLVGDVVQGGCCDGILQPGDVVFEVNGLQVDSSAMIELDGERVQLEELAERAFKGDRIRFVILRDGEKMETEATLAPLPAADILAQKYDELPRYVQFAGLVFQPLQRNVIAAHQLNSIDFTVDLQQFMLKGGSQKKSDIVVVTKVLKDEVNSRFNSYGRRIVSKVNGEEVLGLSHLYSLLYPEDGERPPYTVIEFADGERPLVIDNAGIDAANERIRASYSVTESARLK